MLADQMTPPFDSNYDDDDDDDDADNGYFDGGRGNDDRSPLTVNRKKSVIDKVKKLTPKFKGRKSSQKQDIDVNFDSYPSLDFDLNNLDDDAGDDDNDDNPQRQRKHVDEDGDDNDAKVPSPVDGMTRETSIRSDRSSRSNSNSNHKIVDADDKNASPYCATATSTSTTTTTGRRARTRECDDGDDDDNDGGGGDSRPPSSPELLREKSEEGTPKPPRPTRKPSSMRVPPSSPTVSPSASAKKSPSSSRKPSSLRRRSSSSTGSTYNTPATTLSTDSPLSNNKADSPRVSWQNLPTLPAAESPTVSTKSSVVSSAIGDISPVPNIDDGLSGQKRSSSKRGTEESLKRLSEVFGNDDVGMGGYFSKLHERAVAAGNATAAGSGEKAADARLDQKEGIGGTKSRIKKLFGLTKSPNKVKPRNVAEKLKSDDPNAVMEELNSMLSPKPSSSPNTPRSKILRVERYTDDASEVCSVDFPEIPTQKSMSLSDIKNEVTSSRQRPTEVESQIVAGPPQQEGNDNNIQQVSWRRERTTVRKKMPEHKSSQGSLRTDPESRRSTTRPQSARRIRSTSNDEIDSSVSTRQVHSSSNDELDSSGRTRRIRSSSNDGMESSERSRRVRSSSNDGMDSSEKPIRIRSSSNDGMESSGREKSRSRRIIKADNKDEDGTVKVGSNHQDTDPSNTDKISSHRRHRSLKTYDKPSSRRNHELKSTDLMSSPRRRLGVRRSSSTDGMEEAQPTSTENNERNSLRRRSSRRSDTTNRDQRTIGGEENHSPLRTKRMDDSNEEFESPTKSRSIRRQNGSAASSGRRSSSQREGDTTPKPLSTSPRDTESKRQSIDSSSGKRHRPHGHRKTAANEFKSGADQNSPTCGNSGRRTAKPNSMLQIRSIFSDDKAIDTSNALNNSDGALDYEHKEDDNITPTPNNDVKPDEKSISSEKKNESRIFSSPLRSMSSQKRSNPRGSLVRSLSLTSMGKSTSLNPFGSEKRWSQLDCVEEQSVDGSALFEQGAASVDEPAVSDEKELHENVQRIAHNSFDSGNESEEEEEEELSPLKDTPRSKLSLRDALDRGSAMHSRLFDDDGQQTVITDDGSLWLHEDGTEAAAKIRSSSSICAPQLDFGALAGVRNVE